MSTVPIVANASKLFLGSLISVVPSGDLVLGSANIVSSILDARLATINSAVDTEVARAIASENNLSTAIASSVLAEQTRAQTAEGVINSNIASVAASVAAITMGSDLSADTLVEIMSFAQSVKTLEIGDVVSLTTKLNTIALAVEEKIKVVPSAQIVADSSLPVLYNSASLYDGWYLNKANDSSSKKVNFYFPVPAGLTVAHLYNAYFKLQVLNCSGFPFVAIYTKTDSLTANAKSWYKSKICFDSTNMGVIPQSNGFYLGNACFQPSNAVIASNEYVICPLSKSDVVGSSLGPFASNEIVSLISFQTNSSDTNVQLILQEFGIITNNQKTVFVCDGSFAMGQQLTASEAVVSSALSAEVSRSVAAEAVVSAALSAEVARAESVEAAAAVVAAAEASRAAAAEAVVSAGLATEVSRAATAESVLSASLATKESQLNAIYQYFFNTNADVAPVRSAAPPV